MPTTTQIHTHVHPLALHDALPSFVNIELTIELPNDALSPMRLERVRRSYHLAGVMTMPAIGMNGGVSDLGIVDGVRSLRTTWMPRYVLPRAQATEIPTVPT